MYGAAAYGSVAYGDDLASVEIHEEGVLHVPLITNAFQVFPPESIAVETVIVPHGRPLAEDIRIMRVRRAE